VAYLVPTSRQPCCPKKTRFGELGYLQYNVQKPTNYKTVEIQHADTLLMPSVPKLNKLGLMAVSSFLCLGCRGFGHQTAQCPCWISSGDQNCYMPKSDPYAEEEWLRGFRTQGDSLCQRCEQYRILDKFGISEIQDRAQQIEANQNTTRAVNASLWACKETYIPLGPFKSIILLGHCPLCRLIFRTFPTKGEEIDFESPYYLRPFPSFERQSSFKKKATKDEKAQYGIYFSIENEANALENISKFFGDAHDQETLWRVFRGFGLSSKTPALPRMALNVRRANAMVDFALLRNWLRRCEFSHGISCRRGWPDQLLSSKMIDVSTRTIVPCPLNCRYIALSYVWGGIGPEDKALENRRLPLTIEDAITVTQELGLKYLWVCTSLSMDHLCNTIQTPLNFLIG
jgi:Heterokaryon incompatibility protein (HET)